MKERERGQGRVFLRGNVYWISYYHRGKEYRESSYSTDEAKATKLLRHRLKEIGAAHLGLQQFAPRQDKIFVDQSARCTGSELQARRRTGAAAISGAPETDS